MDWQGIRCLVTGGTGFIGSHLVDELVNRGAYVKVVDDLSRGKLENIQHNLNKIEFVQGDLADMSISLKCTKDIDLCFHLAAIVGGVGLMKEHPASMYKNISIDRNVMEACRKSNVERMLYMSSACVYPIDLQKDPAQPALKEEDVLKYGANPDSTYGWTKLVGELQCKAYYDEYGLKVSIVRPFNPYGSRESFDPKDSHVLPALIRRAAERENPFMIWGNGSQERDFIYVTDVVEGMLLAIEKSIDADPLNFGSGQATSIRTLAELILELMKCHVQIVWDVSKPQGVVSRKSDASKAMSVLNWKPKVGLKEGLQRMIEWYLKTHKNDHEGHD